MSFYKAIFCLLLLLLNSIFYGYKYEHGLSDKLTKDYINLIKKNKTGKEFYKRYILSKKRLPQIYLRYSDDMGLAWYEKNKDRIYFNTKYIMLFFDITDYSDEKIIKVLYFSSDTRREFSKYSDVVYFHELVHSFQDFKYGKARYFKNGLFLELEYEAYLLSDMYFFDKMRREKELFIKILKGEYSDVYTMEYYNGFLSILTDMEDYKKNINMRYLNEVGGYVSLGEEEKKKIYKLEEKKIISYVVGDKISVEDEIKDFESFKKQKEDYTKFINNYYKNIWPEFSSKAIKFVIDSAYEAKNYFVFFNSVYHLRKNELLYNDSDKDIKEKEAVLYLDFQSFVKTVKKEDFEFLAENIMAFEKFCDISNRDIPGWLIEVRDESYKKAYYNYIDFLEKEKDEVKKNYYIEIVRYFCSKIKDLSCDNLIK